MLGDGHVRFGGRAMETDQPRGWHRAMARPLPYRPSDGRQRDPQRHADGFYILDMRGPVLHITA